MKKNLPIKINVASVDEISELFGIGQKLARRIVEHRENNGYFHYPDDLEKVNGISKNLAITLSPVIDWEIPSQTEQTKERDWSNIFLAFFVGISVLWIFLNRVVPKFQMLTPYNNAPNYYVKVWIMGSMVVLSVFILLALSTFVIALYSRSVNFSKRITRTGYHLLFVASLGLISLGVGNFAYYQFFASNGWIELIRDQPALSALTWAFGFLISTIPISIALYFPNLRTNIILAHTYDISLVLSSPIFAWMSWSFRSELPIIFSATFGLAGIMFALTGFNMIRSGESAFQFTVLDSFGEDFRKSVNKSFWQTWVNTRLPDVEQQKELKNALDEIYPPSKFKSIAGAIIFGAGGWIVITAITSVVDWIIQKGLDRLLP